MKQRNITYLLGLFFIAFYSCQTATVEKNPLCVPAANTVLVDNDMPAAPDKDDIISLKMPMHSTQLVLQADDFNSRYLSDTHIKEIQDWWQSLPKEVQKQVQNHQVDVTVISSIITNNKHLTEETTNSQIEQTGAALEKVIGAPTEMTYTVNTTVIEKVVSNNSATKTHPTTADTVAKTDIILSQNVAVKLSQFDLTLSSFSADKKDNENIQTLQYWWSNLPLALQEKIKDKEVAIELILKPLPQVEKKHYALFPSPIEIGNKLDMYFDVLHRLIGLQKDKNNQPQFLAMIAKDKNPIKSNTYYQLEIQLKNNQKAVQMPESNFSM